MSLRFARLALSSALALAALSVLPKDASACGGCFHPADEAETTVVTGHRMAFAISPTRTVLWDQIEYSGNPTEFAWVLPIKPGARLELSNNAWFEALDAATSTSVIAPNLACMQPNDDSGSGCSCGTFDATNFSGSGSSDPPPVTVVHRETVGPYDVLTLHADVPGVLTNWLKSNSFAIDPSVQPIIDAYQSEGFDFIAMRLSPGQGIQQMKPVRVVFPGATPTLPLRMVAAGTGANVAITLFVIGEGIWEAQNFPNAVVNTDLLSWDFSQSASNYATLRQETLAQNEGRTWITTYAKRGVFLSSTRNPVGGDEVFYSSDGSFQALRTIGELYVQVGLDNNETVETQCATRLKEYTSSLDLVVDVCPNEGSNTGTGGMAGTGGAGGSGGMAGTGGVGGTMGSGGMAGTGCGSAQKGQIDSKEFACVGPDFTRTFDDLAAAFTGMRPSNVWLTRLESNLPRAALKDDLNLQANPLQSSIENWFWAREAVNPPCTDDSSTAFVLDPSQDPTQKGGGSGPSKKSRKELAAIVVALAGLGIAFARRLSREPRVVRAS